MSPTYRNDSTTKSFKVMGIDDLPKVVIPGSSVETYDRSVPSDFTLTSSLPTLERRIHPGSGEDVWTGAITPKGRFNVSVSGEFTGTVRLNRSFDAFDTIDKSFVTFTSSSEKYEYEDNDPNVSYRLGVKEGEITVGAVDIILSK